MSRNLTFSLFLVGSLALSACGKKEETASPQGGGTSQAIPKAGADRLTTASLLKLVPSEAQAFVVWDLTGPKYQALRQTPWASEVSLNNTIRKAVDQMKTAGKEQEGMAAQTVIGALEKLGILPVAGQPLPPQPEISQAVAYVLAKDASATPEVALFVTGSGRTKLADKLPVLEDLLKSNGTAPVAEVFEGGIKGFSVPLPLPAAAGAEPATPKSLYVAANDSALSIGLSKDVVLSAFKPAASDRSEALRSSAEFKRAAEAVNSAEEGVGLAYVSLSKILPILDQAAKNSGKTDGSEVDVAKLPVESLVWRQSVGDGFTNRWAVSVSPKTDSQTKIFDALKGSTVPAVAAKLPGDVALMFALDARPLKKLEFLMNDVSDPQSKMIFQQASQLQGATVAVRNNDAGSPFPDIFLFVDSENPDQFVEMVKMGVGSAMGGMGGGAMPWKDTDIEGTKVSFMSTPLGVGLYMGQPAGGKTLVVASSQRSMKDALKAVAGTGQSITSQLQGSVKDQLGAPQGFVSSYINFNEFANVVETVKNSLAMFAGGNTQELDQFLNPAELRKYGVSAGGVSFADGIFSITGRTAPPSVLQMVKAAAP